MKQKWVLKSESDSLQWWNWLCGVWKPSKCTSLYWLSMVSFHMLRQTVLNSLPHGSSRLHILKRPKVKQHQESWEIQFSTRIDLQKVEKAEPLPHSVAYLLKRWWLLQWLRVHCLGLSSTNSWFHIIPSLARPRKGSYNSLMVHPTGLDFKKRLLKIVPSPVSRQTQQAILNIYKYAGNDIVCSFQWGDNLDYVDQCA